MQPYGIYGMNYPMPNSYQNMMRDMPSTMPQQQPQDQMTVVAYTPTAKDFSGVSVQPGGKVLVIAQNEPYMAFKNADNMGMVNTTIYRIEQISENELNAPSQEYATKEELMQLKNVVQQIINSVTAKEGGESHESTT